ncbi:Protein of unknown function [Mesobacillus persicus]|uniref:DUF3231 family protein n=1 Tax=Mesobacillus persicus TaxID=930146 RepID=A0A1H8KMB5_9BACI|nr:DUF3231 family protein [Mesobacillus persicus]SEN94014.1 Protein of unknown function [Mesobacillus persicus]
MNEHNLKLTSAELGVLWSSYMTESATIPVLNYFCKVAEDSEIKPLLEMALAKSTEHLTTLTNVFEQEQYPVPIGFSMEDVDLEAPRLYSDTFSLYFVRNLGKAGIAANGMAFSMAAREDMSKLYEHFLQESTMIEREAKKIMLSKGVFVRPPYIATPKQADIVEKGSFLKGWFGERRSLTAQEIAHIFMNFSNNALGKALLLGFSQTVRSEEVGSYFLRGIEIARSVMETYRTLFEESTLPSPMTWDTEVSDSTVPPFSDKLMLFYTCQLTAIGIGNVGGSLALSMRRDLAAKYLKILQEASLYAEDGLNIMIKNKWFERPPQAIDREHLVKEKKQ